MREGWKTIQLTRCIEHTVTPAKIPRKQFQKSGQFPIVSQERELINGYWSDESAVVRVDSPLVVFGDHTQALKYIDFDFVVGADGTKLLRPKSFLNAKYFYYFLMANPIDALGYARHYRMLKELDINFPKSLNHQKRIVAILDEAFAGIDRAVANTEKNLANARELFESHLNAVFTRKGERWTNTTIGEVIRFIDYRGKTPKKTKSGLRLITAKNVKMGYIQETPLEYVSPESYDDWMTRGIPRRGDVLFTTEAPLANIAQLDTDDKVVFAQRIIIMQPNAAKLSSTFLKYLLLSQTVQQLIRTKGTGATVQGIKASLLKTVEVAFPESLVEQQQIVGKLDVIRTKTQRLESIYQKKLDSLAELKQSILQKAFSGELTANPDKTLKEAAI